MSQKILIVSVSCTFLCKAKFLKPQAQMYRLMTQNDIHQPYMEGPKRTFWKPSFLVRRVQYLLDIRNFSSKNSARLNYEIVYFDGLSAF